jgi:hypothetical protein
MRRLLLASLLMLAATPAFAEDAKVCSKFAWPVHHELDLLRAPPPEGASGAMLAAAPVAVSLKLATGVTLPSPSEKPTDAKLFAGFVTLPAPAAGDYLVSLSGEAWIDVLQDGKPVESYSHSGDPNCPGMRKSVRFTLTAKPVTIQISNGPEDHILLAVTPWVWGSK